MTVNSSRHLTQTENKGTEKENSGQVNFPGVDIMTPHATTTFCSLIISADNIR